MRYASDTSWSWDCNPNDLSVGCHFLRKCGIWTQGDSEWSSMGASEAFSDGNIIFWLVKEGVIQGGSGLWPEVRMKSHSTCRPLLPHLQCGGQGLLHPSPTWWHFWLYRAEWDCQNASPDGPSPDGLIALSFGSRACAYLQSHGNTWASSLPSLKSDYNVQEGKEAQRKWWL